MIVSDDVWSAGGAGGRISLGGASGGGAPGFAPLTGLGNVVAAVQIVGMVLTAAITAVELVYWTVDPAGFADASGESDSALGIALALTVGLIGISALALMLLGAPLWVWWHWRAGANLEALGIPHEYGPLAHAGWWFVPIANLFVPFRAMSELYGHSTAGPDEGYRVAESFPLWWGCWIVSNILTNVSFRMSLQWEMAEPALALDVVSTPLSVVATVLYVRYVRKISAGQDQLAAAARTA